MALTKVQEFYIKEHAFKTDSKVIAKDVGATKKEVDAFIKTLPVPEPPKPAQPITAKDYIQNTTAEKRNKTVAIMTEAASGMGDTRNTKKPLEAFSHCLAPSKRNG